MTAQERLLHKLYRVHVDTAAGWLKGGTAEFKQADAALARRTAAATRALERSQPLKEQP